MNKDTYYFSHDTNAFLDPKIRIMISEYGIISYAIFWIIVEMLASQKDYKIPLNGFTKSLLPLLQGKHLDYDPDDGIGGYTDAEGNNVNVELVGCHRIAIGIADSIFGMMIDVGLFKTDEKYFWSESLISRMKERQEKANKQREIANKRWHPKSKVDNNNTNALPTALPDNMPRNALKERKGKERKESINNNDVSSNVVDNNSDVTLDEALYNTSKNNFSENDKNSFAGEENKDEVKHKNNGHSKQKSKLRKEA